MESGPRSLNRAVVTEDASAGAAPLAKRKVADASLLWLRRIEKMTEPDRQKIRDRIARGVVLTVDNTAILHAMRVFDQRTRVLRDMPRHRGMKRV